MYSKLLFVLLSGMLILSACGSRETQPVYNPSAYSRYSPTVGSNYGNGYDNYGYNSGYYNDPYYNPYPTYPTSGYNPYGTSLGGYGTGYGY